MKVVRRLVAVIVIAVVMFVGIACKKQCKNGQELQGNSCVDTVTNVEPEPMKHVNIIKTLSGFDIMHFPRDSVTGEENLNVYFSALRNLVAAAQGRNELIDSVLLESLGDFGPNATTGGAGINAAHFAWFVDSLQSFANIKDLEKTCIIIDGKPVNALNIYRSDSALLADKYKAIIEAGSVREGR
jgi:hypothetical protein